MIVCASQGAARLRAERRAINGDAMDVTAVGTRDKWGMQRQTRRACLAARTMRNGPQPTSPVAFRPWLENQVRLYGYDPTKGPIRNKH